MQLKVGSWRIVVPGLWVPDAFTYLVYDVDEHGSMCLINGELTDCQVGKGSSEEVPDRPFPGSLCYDPKDKSVRQTVPGGLDYLRAQAESLLGGVERASSIGEIGWFAAFVIAFISGGLIGWMGSTCLWLFRRV